MNIMHAIEILRFYDFADFAGKCLFGPILDTFERFWEILGDFDPYNCDAIDLTTKVYACSSPGDTRYEILLVKIGSEACSVSLFKKALGLR